MKKPRVITLCGSTRFPQAFELANMHLSLQGHIVISLGCFGHVDQPVGAKFLVSDGDESTKEKQALDQLHYRKIDLSDEIFVINVGGYIGSSTRREIEYAQQYGKTVRYMFPQEPVAKSRLSESNVLELDDAERAALGGLGCALD